MSEYLSHWSRIHNESLVLPITKQDPRGIAHCLRRHRQAWNVFPCVSVRLEMAKILFDWRVVNIEVVRAIAALCMVAGGDKNDMASVIGQIEQTQIQCHRHYAKCYKKESDWSKCILSRKTDHDIFVESIKK